MSRHPRFIQDIESSGGPVVTGGVDGVAELDNGMRYPGHGLPPRAEDSMSALQPFARLSRGQALGKKEILSYDGSVDGRSHFQSSMTTILTIGGREGSDLDACQMCVTLSQPRVIKSAVITDGIGNYNQQNASGSYDNAGIGVDDFPGTGAPIAWAPITAIIEWGLGGTSHRAFVDFVQGATINLAASWVRVHAAVAPDAANADGTSALYELAANVGPGWPRPGVAQRTVFLPIIDAGVESGVFAVPPFAKRAQIISRDPIAVGSNPPALTTAYLRFWQGPTGVAGGFNVGNFFQAGNNPEGFDVPNAGAYFSVQSGMSVNAPFAVIFDLAV